MIEVGYAEEQKRPLTTKQLFLLNLTSSATVRRRLVKLIDKGIVKRRSSAEDRRSTVLTISAPTVKLLDKYASTLTAIFAKIQVDSRNPIARMSDYPTIPKLGLSNEEADLLLNHLIVVQIDLSRLAKNLDGDNLARLADTTAVLQQTIELLRGRGNATAT